MKLPLSESAQPRAGRWTKVRRLFPFPLRRLMRIGPSVVLLLGTAGFAGLLAGCEDDPASVNTPPQQDVTDPSQSPGQAETPTVVKAEPEPPTIARYGELLAADMPELPTTQPLTMRLPLESSAKIELDQATYLDPVGRLWITDPRGVGIRELITGDKERLKAGDFVVRDRVRFVIWGRDEGGDLELDAIVEEPGGELVWHHRLGSAEVAAGDYNFAKALLYGGGIAVPTRGGVAILTAVDRPNVASYLRRYGERYDGPRPNADGRVERVAVDLSDLDRYAELRLDGRGLIAWVPVDSAESASRIAAHDGAAWNVLEPSDGWAERPVHLMPLSDGTVLQLALDDAGDAVLRNATLHELVLDESEIELAVDQLASPSYKQRDEAMNQLLQAGSAAWPTLERMLADQPAGVQNQIDILLLERTRPSLAGVVPEPGPVVVRSRLSDGGVILEFPEGVVLPDDAGVYLLQAPAYLSVRPGRRTTPLPRRLVDEMQMHPDTHIDVWGDELLVLRPGAPVRRWLSNHFEAVTGEALTMYQDFVGIDRDGRWLFRGEDEAENTGARASLLVDVRLTDSSPQLPTWVIEAGEEGEAGWDDEGWPSMRNGSVWRLAQFGWEALEDQEQDVLAEPAAAGASSIDTVAPDGTRYELILRSLLVVRPGGSQSMLDLPEHIRLPIDPSQIHLAATSDGQVFLFNAPGVITQLEVVAGQVMEVATFEGDVPRAVPRRVWIDPAGRLCATYFDNLVAVMWPDGQVPQSIRQLMPAKRRDDRGDAVPDA